MLGTGLRRSLLEIRIPTSSLPPTFLLPSRARYFNSTIQHIETPPDDLAASQYSVQPSDISQPVSLNLPRDSIERIPEPPVFDSTPLPLSSSIKELLPILSAQPSHYISAHIHGRPYLVTAGDVVRLPFQMPGVIPGDTLRLNRASIIGSRDYTLKGAPYLDERIFECRARVMGTEAEPMRIKEKTKRRNRKVKTVKSKHRFTILRICELKIKSLEELEETSLSATQEE